MKSLEVTGTWTDVVARKRQIREAALRLYQVDDVHSRTERVDNVSERSSIEPQSAQDITDIDSVELLHHGMKEGRFTAEDVVLAYIKRFANLENTSRGCLANLNSFGQSDCCSPAGEFEVKKSIL